MKLLEVVLNKRKAVCWVLFVGYCGFIVWMTLLSRRVTEREYEFGLFWGFRLWVDNDPLGNQVLIQYINNILFFIPFGLILRGIVRNWKYVMVVGLCSSAAIELTQYITARGLAETDDVISNTIGALIGCALWGLMKKGVERYIDVR